MSKRSLYQSCSVTVFVSILGLGNPANAQEVTELISALDEQESSTIVEEIEEIIVTARRGAERYQDVPASVSVLSEAAIEARGITTIEQAVNLTPGVTIVTNTAEVGDTQISIRGVNGARDAESNVAFVVDGILKTNTSVLNQDQGNLVQIEILKGPQGAYYGRNAEAGAIVMQTRKPSDTLELRGKLGYGNDDTQTGFVSVSGPITGTVGALLSADYRHTDGFYRNNGPIADAQGATVDQQESWNINGRIIAEIGDSTDFDLKAKYGEVRSGSINYNVVFALPNFAALNPAFNNDVNTQPFQFLSNIPSDGNQRTIELSGLVNTYFSDMKLTGWAAYADVNQDLLADAAAAAFGFFNNTPECRNGVAALYAAGFTLPAPQILGEVPDSSLFVPNGSLISSFSPTTCDGAEYQIRNQSDFSAEIRLASDGNNKIDWSIGGYFLKLKREVGVNLSYDRGLGLLRQIYAPPGSANPTEQLAHDRFNTDVYAAFGSLDYDLTDNFAISAALRYDREERKVRNLVDPTLRNQFVSGGNVPLNIGLLFGPLDPQQRTFTQLQPKIALLYKASPNLSIFANWGIGFKSGGFNNQGSEAIIDVNFNQFIGAGLDINDDYEKEESSAFELGFKGQLFDGRLSLEGAGYYTKITNMQFFEFFVGNFGILRVVSNIDKVEIYGAELGAKLKVADQLSLYASGNITETEIIENSARPNTEGGKAPYTSDFTVNFGADLNIPINGDLAFTGILDVRVIGPTWFHTSQTTDQPSIFNGILPLAGLPAELGVSNLSKSRRDTYTIADLRFGIKSDSWHVVVFANNLFEERYLDEVIPAPDFGGSFISPGNKRSFGVEFGFAF